jgi:putative oxygen-independent coproporphyrinogen III oxidase
LSEPLGVYVHWPYCARICPYCDFNVVREHGQRIEQAALVRAILGDLREQRLATGPRRLVSIFFGGGTPSLMDPDWTAEIIATARALWSSPEPPEITLEANPTDAEMERFVRLADAGVNRLSLGVQSLDDEALAFLGRNHGGREAVKAMQVGRAAFPLLSIDLIYARPEQTAFAWAAELETVARVAGADHLSPYQLTIEPGTAFAKATERGDWAAPDPDLGAALYQTTQDVLGGMGFVAYEVSNHANSREACCAHNLLYWQGADYVGVGPGAHGRLTLGGARTALKAPAKVREYIKRVEETGQGWETREVLNPVQAAEERLLTGLRTIWGVDLAELAPLGLVHGHPKLAELQQAGLIDLDAQRLTATAAGRTVLDRVTTELACA